MIRLIEFSRQPSLVSVPGIEVVTLGTRYNEGTIPKFPSLQPVLSRCADLHRVWRGELGKFDAIISECAGGAYFGGPVRRMVKAGYEQFLSGRLLRLRDRLGIPLAILDYADDLTLHRANRVLLEGCDLYFKRELGVDPWRSLEGIQGGRLRIPTIGYRMASANEALMKKLRPLSIGLGLREAEARQLAEKGALLRSEEKTWDVFCALNAWCRPLRQSVLDQSAEIASAGIRLHAAEQTLSYPEYAEGIRRSRLCLSPTGLGWDCYRHYEAALFGSIPVMSRCDIRPYQPFLHGIDGFYYDPERPLLPQLQQMLSGRYDLDQMAMRAEDKVRSYHLREAKTHYVADEIHRLL